MRIFFIGRPAPTKELCRPVQRCPLRCIGYARPHDRRRRQSLRSPGSPLHDSRERGFFWPRIRIGLQFGIYLRRNSSYLTGSWLNHCRSSVLGATSLSQSLIANEVFLYSSGPQSLASNRVPSALLTGSYTRLILIIANLPAAKATQRSLRPDRD